MHEAELARKDLGSGEFSCAAWIARFLQGRGVDRVFGLQGGGIGVNRINDGLIVKPDSPIKSFADLKGKTLGHVPGIQWRTISRHMVRSAGLNPDTDIKLIDLAVAMQVPAVGINWSWARLRSCSEIEPARNDDHRRRQSVQAPSCVPSKRPVSTARQARRKKRTNMPPSSIRLRCSGSPGCWVCRWSRRTGLHWESISR